MSEARDTMPGAAPVAGPRTAGPHARRAWWILQRVTARPSEAGLWHRASQHSAIRPFTCSPAGPAPAARRRERFRDVACVNPASADLRMIVPVACLWCRPLLLRSPTSGMDGPVGRFG